MACVGLGIQSDAVTELYPRSLVVNNVGHLGREGLKLLGQVLLGDGRRRVA